MTPQQVEEHYSEWCCEQNHLTDGIALFLILPTLLGITMKATGHASMFAMALIVCTVCLLTNLWLVNPAKYQKWRLPLRSGVWYLTGICSFLHYTRLQGALKSGEQRALWIAVLLSKWPELGVLTIMFPLGSRYLVKTGLPVLLFFHIAALMAASLVAEAVDDSPVFASAVTQANSTLHLVSYILLSVHGFTPLTTAAIMGLPARFWVLVYWLSVQSVVFWSLWWGSLVWEAKSRATFLQLFCGEMPRTNGDRGQSFKLCVSLQWSMAGLALGCILHKTVVAYLSSILTNFILFRS